MKKSTRRSKPVISNNAQKVAGSKKKGKDITKTSAPDQVLKEKNDSFQKDSAEVVVPADLNRGIIGTDGKPVTIAEDKGAYSLKGSPNADTKTILEALLTTPEGVKIAKEYTGAKYEFRLRLSNVVYKEDGVTKAHGATYESDEDNNKINENSTKPFHHWNVDISLAITEKGDRMSGWSDEMKLNVIASHEKAHVTKGGMESDVDHQKGTAYMNELVAAFQYHQLHLSKTPILKEPWIQNYNSNKDIGIKTVNKAYKVAIQGLIKAGKLEAVKGQKQIEDFIKGNK